MRSSLRKAICFATLLSRVLQKKNGRNGISSKLSIEHTVYLSEKGTLLVLLRIQL
jgi:hypothetical protein